MHRKLQYLREEYNIKRAQEKIATIEKENKRSEILETLKNNWVALLKDPTYGESSKKFYVPLQWTVDYNLKSLFAHTTARIEKTHIQISCFGDDGVYNEALIIRSGSDNAICTGLEFLGGSMMHWTFGVGEVGINHSGRLNDKFFKMTSHYYEDGHNMQGQLAVVLVTIL